MPRKKKWVVIAVLTFAASVGALWKYSHGERSSIGCTMLGHGIKTDALEVRIAIFSPDERLLATGGRLPKQGGVVVQLWDFQNGQLIKTLKSHDEDVSAIAFSPDVQRLAVGAATYTGNTIEIWNIQNGKVEQLINGQGLPYALAFSPDGETLGVATAIPIPKKPDDIGKGRITLWDTRTWNLKWKAGDHPSAIYYDVSFSPDGAVLASGGSDNLVRLWDARTGKLKRMLRGHQDGVQGVAFISLPSGLVLASVAQDGEVRLWEPQTGKLKQMNKGDRLSTFAFSADGRYYATGYSRSAADVSRETRVHVHETVTGRLICSIEKNDAYLYSLALNPQGTLLALGDGGTLAPVYLWRVHPS